MAFLIRVFNLNAFKLYLSLSADDALVLVSIGLLLESLSPLEPLNCTSRIDLRTLGKFGFCIVIVLFLPG
jgi:hypothetical protein